MKEIEIIASKKYIIHIGSGLLESSGTVTKSESGGQRAVLVTDRTVNMLYADRVEQSLLQSGFSVCRFIMPQGEESKSMEMLARLLDFFSAQHLTRSDTVVALGGGVVGDTAGFAASVYLRGIHLVQLPTTLLSSVDSSVGGKTAINLTSGKNLAGSFYQPDAVICDYSTLSTLSADTFADGCAEVIKYGVILDKEFFTFLCHNEIKDNLEYIISHCVELKNTLVSEDEYDRGRRALLNFGHTAGHAIEKYSGYKVSHGSAVGIGMLIASHGAYAMGFCDIDYSPNIKELLEKNDLPVSCPFEAAELFHAALSDKKISGSKITLVLPKSLGCCVTHSMDTDSLLNFFETGLKY